MSRLPVTLACFPYDRVQPIRDGRVAIEGCDVNFLALPPEQLFFRALTHAEFDICELSLSSYLICLSTGDSRYTAIPVFVSRLFRHSAIYVRKEGVIRTPEDLKGRRVGVPEYQVTAAAWVRGLLDDEYGVSPSDFSWHRGGLNEPGRSEKVSINLPASISIESIPAGETLDSLLSKGELDAVISPRPPRSFHNAEGNIQRLFPQYRELERDYFARTRIFPIMHIVAIRTSLLEQHPWLASSAVEAFIKAKDLVYAQFNDIAALPITLPWLGPELDETRQLMGNDFWPYGVEANRPTLTAILDYSYRHGTTPRKLEISEAFASSTMSRFKV